MAKLEFHYLTGTHTNTLHYLQVPHFSDLFQGIASPSNANHLVTQHNGDDKIGVKISHFQDPINPELH